MYSEDGKPDRFVGVVVDITSQKNAQERQRLLAREADHRVKNIFANFHSMISLSARSARTPQGNGRSSSWAGRRAVAGQGPYSTRYQTGVRNTKASKRRWMRWCAQSCSLMKTALPTRIILNGPDVPVGAKAVTGLALALHETATNAVKHGVLSRPERFNPRHMGRNAVTTYILSGMKPAVPSSMRHR